MSDVPIQRPGATASRSITATLDDARVATEQVTARARRLLAIYTPDLEPAIYDDPRFLETLRKLVLTRGYARVRVLLADPARVIYDASKFVRLARRITSHIDIRNIRADYRSNHSAFVIADDRALYYRAQAAGWHGIVETDDAAVARRYLAWFEEAWLASDPQAGARQQQQ